MAQVGVRTTVGLWSAPWTSYSTLTPSRVTDPLLSGWRARIPGLLPVVFQDPVDHGQELCVAGAHSGQPPDHDAEIEGHDQGHHGLGRIERGVDAELAEPDGDRRPAHAHPAPVHALETFRHDRVVPAHRRQLEPDLLVAGGGVLV